VQEVVNNYDVDGVHFDYIRYPDNGDMFPDGAVYAKYGYPKSLRAWREDNINRLVIRIYDWVKQSKPWVQVSTSPVGKYSPLNEVPNAGQTGLSVYQNTLEWLRQEKQDMIVPMMYFRGNFFYPFIKHWISNKNGRYVVPGLSIYRMQPPDNWSLADVSAQIEYLRSSQADGISFFRGSQLFGNSKGLYHVLKNNYFRYPALLPPLTWLSNEKPPAPVSLNVMKEGNLLRVSWSMPRGSDDSYTYTIYCSQSKNVNTTQSSTILATGLRKSETYFSSDMDKEQEFTFTVTASSRYHIESDPSQEVYFYLSKYTK
jgi:uncharacterized lipoprotein YddW (UPF0748 family)